MSFHLFHANELYSNADGTIQFIEMVAESAGQQFWSGHTITATQGGTTHSFTFVTNLPGATALGKTVLIATQGFADLGIVTPDYLIPSGFLFTTGAVAFTFGEGADSLTYSALPTDGTLSINHALATAVNSPKNFAGAAGTVVLNSAPLVSNPVADQYAGAGDAFELALPASTFTDANGDLLTYSATLATSDDPLPAWLSFVPGTRTFSGTPGPGDSGTLSIKVSVSDGHDHTTTDVFNLTVVSGDVEIGTAGDDSLAGSAGDDALVGGAGNDAYVFDSTGDQVIELTGQGTDLVLASITVTALAANVENLTLTGSDNLDATGNSGANVITGNAGENVLNGGGGNDSLIGGDGNDTYVVDSTTDTITEGLDEGEDLVLAGLTLPALAANVENLTLTGTGNFNATGNALLNKLTGNDGNNILDGGAGADTMAGGAGNDTLTGGSGADVFLFDQASGTDRITDFISGTDQLQLDNAVFTALVSEGALAAGSLQLALHGAISDTSGDNASDGLQDYLKYATDTGQLYYDANGTAAGGLQLIATLAAVCGGTHPLFNLTTAQDIVVV